MNEEILRIVARFVGFFAAISFGVAAKTIIESKKQKVYGKFIFVDLMTAAFVGYLILPYLDANEWLFNWKGQILALTGYLGTWMLNSIIKLFKSKVGSILNQNNKNDNEI